MPNARSAKVLGEEVILEIAYSDRNRQFNAIEETTPKTLAEISPSFIPGVLAPLIAGAVVDQIGKTLTAEAERYQTTYSADAGGDQFYFRPFATKEAAPAASPRATDIKFAGFKVTRMATTSDGRQEAAMTACIIALPGSVDDFFYLVPVSFEFAFSKAKVVAFDLTSPFGVDILNPWEIITDPLLNGGYELPPRDDDVDLKLSISLENMHFDKAGKLNITNTAAEAFDLKGVKLSSPAVGEGRNFSGYEAFLEKLGAESEAYKLKCDEHAGIDEIATLRDRIFDLPIDGLARLSLTATGRAFPSPKRAIATGPSNANFLVRAMIEETDEYGARIKELNAAFEKEKPGVQKGLTDFLDGKK